MCVHTHELCEPIHVHVPLCVCVHVWIFICVHMLIHLCMSALLWEYDHINFLPLTFLVVSTSGSTDNIMHHMQMIRLCICTYTCFKFWKTFRLYYKHIKIHLDIVIYSGELYSHFYSIFTMNSALNSISIFYKRYSII